MRKIKLIIPIVLLFMVIGFATITTSLSINADMELLGDLDNFAIYYSRAVVNGQVDPSIIVSSTELDFGAALKEVGTPYVIEYDITNASSSFDAEIEMTCTGSTEYFEVSNVFDNSIPLEARQTRTGTLTLKKIKTLAGDAINSTVTCSVIATPVERNSESILAIPAPLENPYTIGKEVSIGTEKFNIISTDSDTVTMLAQYNLGSDYLQSEEEYDVDFSDHHGWEYTPGPKEVDIQTWTTNPKVYVNAYVDYLKEMLNDDNVIGDLITLKDLESLGCAIISDYSSASDFSAITCVNSPYNSWIVNGQHWWTRSAVSDMPDSVWIVSGNGFLDTYDWDFEYGVRPTITLDKDIVYSLIKNKFYSIGEEVSIAGEEFNVISQTGDAVKLLAQYNIDTTYRQNATQMYTYFSDESGWEYTPGPKEIDIQNWGGDVKYVLNSYVSYLKTLLGNNAINGDFIALTELEVLGCTIDANYSNPGGLTCTNSSHKKWLVNGQNWWSKSAFSGSGAGVWYITSSGTLSPTLFNVGSGVRPVISVSKDVLSSITN